MWRKNQLPDGSWYWRNTKMTLEMAHYVQFETSTNCHKSCKFCTHAEMTPRPEMSDELIKMIIDELVPTATDVCPFLMQEPLLETRLPVILEQIKRKNWRAKTWIYTTGDGLNEVLMRKLVDDKCLDQICFSYAGATKDGIENVKRLLRYREKELYSKPNVEVHVITTPETQLTNHTIDYVLVGLADGIRYVPFDTFHGDIEYWGDKKELEAYEQVVLGQPKIKREPCPRLWNTFNVHSNGNVVPCCICWNDDINMGNINDQSAEEIWNGDKFNELRIMHMRGEWDKIPLCKNCSSWRWM
jgi:radical SAM protein with 4Fe4S-binding SPASM domain